MQENVINRYGQQTCSYSGQQSLSSSWWLITLLIVGAQAVTGCTASPSNIVSNGGNQTITQVAKPAILTTAAQNGAVIVSLSDDTANARIYYTVDGSMPTSASPRYLATFLVAANTSVQAVALASGDSNSAIAAQSFAPNIASGTLVWSDEFTNSSGANAQPDPAVWGNDTGGGGWGNSELETYCGWGSTTSPCSSTSPNGYVGTDGYLHIVAQQPSTGVFTSARLKTEGLFSFQYGRLEFRAKVPEAQGLWPAAWLMGNNIATVNWPACGEQDVMERVNAPATPDFNVGSVHGPGFTGSLLSSDYYFPNGVTAANWHMG